MSNFWKNENGVLEPMAGSNIVATIAEAIVIAGEQDRPITFVFNGVTITVHSDSNPELIHRDWSRAMSGYINKSVDPYPTSVLTEKERASDARIHAKNERKNKRRQARYQAKVETARKALEAKLAKASLLEFSDETAWKKFKEINQDFYGAGVVNYAERWARLMQLEICNGKSLEDVAEATSREADYDGITGYMYGCAVSALAHCWKYGEQLRRWHNLKTQLGDEGEQANESGGVLNPALLCVG